MWGLFVALRKAARIGRVRQLAVGFAAVVLCIQAAAAADPPAGTSNWGGLNWGIGIATDFDIGGTRVVSAITTPPNNTVRLENTSSNVGISFVLEAHYFLRDKLINFANLKAPGECAAQAANTSNGYLNCTEVAHGPFVAIEVGGGTAAPTGATTGPITAFAMGWMIGLHHPRFDKGKEIPDTSSWNLGIGFRVDPGAKVLGDGLVVNQPLPAGDIIRYKTEPRYGLMLMSSFSF